MLPALQTVVLRTRDATFSETSRFTYTRRYLLFGAASPASSLSRSQRHSQIGCQARGVTRPGALAGWASMGQHGPARGSIGQHGPAWASTGQYGPAWASTGQHGPARASAGQHGPAWVSLGEHGPAWASMGQHGPAWASMGQHGPAWASMGQHGPAWTSMGTRTVYLGQKGSGGSGGV
jgi:hypothetical protein